MSKFVIIGTPFGEYNWVLKDNRGVVMAEGSNWLKSERAIRKRIKKIRMIFHSAGVYPAKVAR